MRSSMRSKQQYWIGIGVLLLFAGTHTISAQMAMEEEADAPMALEEDTDQRYEPGQLIVRFEPTEPPSSDQEGRARAARRDPLDLIPWNVGVIDSKELFVKEAQHPQARAAMKQSTTPVETILTEREKLQKALFAKHLSNIHLLEVEDVIDGEPRELPDLAAEIAAIPGIKWAQPNYFYYRNQDGDADPDLPLQYGLFAIEADEAWEDTETTTGSEGEGVVVAIIDAGVDHTHPDLAANIWENPGETGLDDNLMDKRFNGIDDDDNGYVDDVRGWDFRNDDNDPATIDTHGTHIAGIIAAVRNNGIGIAGIAPKAKIMILKALSDTGRANNLDLAEAVKYAADNGAQVTNNSYGRKDVLPEPMERESFDYAHGLRVVSVASVGNGGRDVGIFPDFNFPSELDTVIAVASVNRDDVRSESSNYGFFGVDLSAPGDAIHSTLNGNDYGEESGTSFAVPHVAGVAALIRSKYPDIGHDGTRGILFTTSDSIEIIDDKLMGRGRVNAFKSLHETGVELGWIFHKVPEQKAIGQKIRIKQKIQNHGTETAFDVETRTPVPTGWEFIPDPLKSINCAFVQTGAYVRCTYRKLDPLKIKGNRSMFFKITGNARCRDVDDSFNERRTEITATILSDQTRENGFEPAKDNNRNTQEVDVICNDIFFVAHGLEQKVNREETYTGTGEMILGYRGIKNALGVVVHTDIPQGWIFNVGASKNCKIENAEDIYVTCRFNRLKPNLEKAKRRMAFDITREAACGPTAIRSEIFSDTEESKKDNNVLTGSVDVICRDIFFVSHDIADEVERTKTITGSLTLGYRGTADVRKVETHTGVPIGWTYLPDVEDKNRKKCAAIGTGGTVVCRFNLLNDSNLSIKRNRVMVFEIAEDAFCGNTDIRTEIFATPFDETSGAFDDITDNNVNFEAVSIPCT